MKKQMITGCDWLYAEWHPTKNKGLNPAEISVGSNLVVWWMLHYTDRETNREYDFEWQAEIRGRFRNHSQCPYLTGNAVWSGFNDLKTKYPELAAEWHPVRNGILTPDKILPASNKEVWWFLPYDDPNTGKHFDFVWKAPVISRTKKNCGCPFLTNKRLWKGFNDLATLHPDLALEWNVEKNEMQTDEVLGQSAKKYWWIQYYDDELTGKRFCFEWQATINARANGSGNPYLAGRLLFPGYNDLETKYPEIAEEWHPTRNGTLLPGQVFAKDSRRVWWYKKYYDPLLDKEFEFEWETTVGNRTANNAGCPFLSGRSLWPGFNDLATRFPTLVQEWDYEKNEGLTPGQVMPGSGVKVWWKIPYTDPNTHEKRILNWKTSIVTRTQGHGCPFFSNKRVLPGLNDLATTHPHLAEQWHPTKNGNLTPEQVTYGGIQQIWWYLEYYDGELDKTFQFEWKASINARTNRDTGCPYLSNTAVWTGYNDLQTRYPEIASEWDYEKNGDLIPETVIATSNTSVWWRVPYTNSQTGEILYLSWKTRIRNRTVLRTECPYLTNTAVYSGINDLQTQYPEIAAQWHPTKNRELTADKVFPYDKRSVWWYMPYDDQETGKHFDFEWRCVIQSRVANGTGCPYLSGAAVWTGYNDLQTTHPEIANQWNYEKNGELTPEQVSYGSVLEVWWVYPYDDPKTGKHFNFEWKAMIVSRTIGGNGCPYLTNSAVWVGYNDLQTTHPEVANQWHPTKNGDLSPEMVTYGSNQLVWWLYPYDDPRTGKHFDFEWSSTVAVKVGSKYGCPYLTNDAVWVGYNDLQTTHPEVANQWHPTKNGDLSPEMVTYGSNQLVWWLYPYDDPRTGKHFDFEWFSTVAVKVGSKYGCPYLTNDAVWAGFNDLQTCCPEIALQWSSKNRLLSPDTIYKFSHKKVWWHCQICGTHWRTSVSSRTVRGTGCPVCERKNRNIFLN